MSSNLVQTVVLCVLLGLTAACGGGRQARGGEDILTGALPSLMAEPEERARDFLLDMAFVLEENTDDPGRAVDRLEAMLRVNRAAVMENARAVEARFNSFEGAERRVYEAQFAALMQPAYVRWRAVRDDLIRADTEVGRRLAILVEQNDTGQ